LNKSGAIAFAGLVAALDECVRRGLSGSIDTRADAAILIVALHEIAATRTTSIFPLPPLPEAIHQITTRIARLEPELLARDMAEFVTTLRKANLNDGPSAYRGVPLATADPHARAAIEDLRRTDESIDADTAMAAWKEAAAAPPWTAAPCWVHSDLMPSNLLVTGDRLTAVLDFATIGVGDPACDLIPAWNLLPASARQIFRDNVNVDDATWTRGRGWALSMAVGQLPYYRNTNPIISANARHVITEILTTQTG
jgi:aminoglycoside phosphotransferase (APT) family kinase protein